MRITTSEPDRAGLSACFLGIPSSVPAIKTSEYRWSQLQVPEFFTCQRLSTCAPRAISVPSGTVKSVTNCSPLTQSSVEVGLILTAVGKSTAAGAVLGINPGVDSVVGFQVASRVREALLVGVFSRLIGFARPAQP